MALVRRGRHTINASMRAQDATRTMARRGTLARNLPITVAAKAWDDAMAWQPTLGKP